MLKVNIITIGKIKEKYITDGILEYLKRLSRYVNIKIIELNEEADNETSIKKESDKINELLLKTKSFKILMDINGKTLDSVSFANLIDKVSLTNSEISFIIGGSKGVNDSVRDNCDLLLSISKMTFPHQLFRMILLEQIYRAITILNNIKYHK